MFGTESVGERTKHLRFCRLRRVELAITKVLWDAGVPLTAREVFEELHRRGRWSYLTVRTTMTRMVDAGVLGQQRRGRSNLYEPTVERHAVAATCVEEVISQVLGGDLAHGVVSVLKHLPLSRDALGLVRRSVSDVSASRGLTSGPPGRAGMRDDPLTEAPIRSVPPP
jgi:predicted transcriptional regulator